MLLLVAFGCYSCKKLVQIRRVLSVPPGREACLHGYAYPDRDFPHLDLLQNISEKIIDNLYFFHTIRPIIVEQKFDVSIP